ncbi:MAG: MBL fold metallo-hydrolase [Muribaculaceae bacterium]|nr:MBL fold metallo-hydrolase [Muribaculaceae bacterium]
MNHNKDKYRHRASEYIKFDYDDTEPTTIDSQVQETSPAVGERRGENLFMSFGSGSSGNCAYLGTFTSGILIDAGIDIDHVFDVLKLNGIFPYAVKGIILTHDHQDHVRYVYSYLRNNKHLRVYCTPKLLNGLLRRHNISRKLREYHEPIYKEIPFHLAGMTITAFETSHDGTDNMGFNIEIGNCNFVVATDMGIITPRAEYYMSKANHLMIESNYDSSMLTNGTYPEYLKSRVRGERGHLDNVVATRFVTDHYHEGLRNVFLCHLSNDNNRPEIACHTMTQALLERGVTVGDASNSPDQRNRDIQLYALPRFKASPLFVL